jgi:hypothetical protein
MLVPDTDQSIDTDIEDGQIKKRKGIKALVDHMSDQESPRKSDPEMHELDIRNTVLQGSFLPVCLVSSRGAFPLNSFIFD